MLCFVFLYRHARKPTIYIKEQEARSQFNWGNHEKTEVGSPKLEVRS